MPIVLQLPAVDAEPHGRPQQCPFCGSPTLQRWGSVRKTVRDQSYRSVLAYRYRCPRCGHTFRDYPSGVDRADQTQRLRKLAALLCALGLSVRGVSAVLAVFGVQLNRMTAWRDLQEQAALLTQRRSIRSVRVLGVDGVYVKRGGQTRGVVVAVDMGDGQPVAVAELDERDAQAVGAWLKPLVARLGVRVVVTDDLAGYRGAAEQSGVVRQVCWFHVQRWVRRRLNELRPRVAERWREVVEETQRAVDELAADGKRRLFELWQQLPGRQSEQGDEALMRLRDLVLRLSEDWEGFRVFRWAEGVPKTNNRTEQAIGRMQMRARTVRGYKSLKGMLAGLMLSGCGSAW
ncbi:MAG: transposase [Thermoflexales bacterium]